MKCSPKGNHCSDSRRSSGADEAQHPAGVLGAPGGEVDPELVPGGEAPGPLAGLGHVAEHRLLGADLADQRHRAVEQHPPAVGGPALVEEQLAAAGDLLGRGLEQRGELGVVEAVEQGEPAQLGNVHQTLDR